MSEKPEHLGNRLKVTEQEEKEPGFEPLVVCLGSILFPQPRYTFHSVLCYHEHALSNLSELQPEIQVRVTWERILLKVGD